MSRTRLQLSPGDPIGQLEPQAWMEAAETRRVVAALQAGGTGVRFVGGCVRDAILKRSIKDIDIATPDPPRRVMELLQAAGIHAIPTGIGHGTVTAVIGKAHFEITTLRLDVETFGRHARIQFTDDWRADASRRDFTMNALSADPEGRVFDPFDGMADMAAGRVRFVGDPATRIGEDALRLLRFFRFHAHYGRGSAMDSKALAACRRLAPDLDGLSGERVAGELVRLLLAADPLPALLAMHSHGVLAHILPEAAAFGRLRCLVWLESRGLARAEVEPDSMRRLAALVETDKAGAHALGERLKLSGAQTRRVTALAAPAIALDAAMDGRAIRRALRRLGSDTFRDLVLLAWAARRALEARPDSEATRRWTAMLDAARAWQPVELPLRGRDLLGLGVPHGPRIGELLGVVEAWWEESDYAPGRQECLDYLCARMEAGL